MPNHDRPNLLLIMTDQHRGDCLGCDGHPVLETPFLDDLAGNGTRFTAAYSAVPSCIPARATLMTGMDQWHTGVLGMGRSGSSMTTTYAHTLPGELAAAGYHTQGIGKMHFNPQRALYGFHNILLDESSREQTPGFKSDYRKWFEENKTERYGYHDHAVDWNSWMARPTHLPEHLHPTWWTAQQSIDWLDRRDPTKPFFLKTSFARPHSPYDAPQVYYDMYKDRELPRPYIGDWADCNDIDCDDVNAWRTHRSTEQIHRARACYYGNVTFIDHQIGRLLYELRMKDPQAYRNTFVIFTSDHGDMLGDHHLWRKTYGYEGSARIPFIIRPPLEWDCPRGQALEQVMELRDVMPTLLQAAGVPIPETVDGLSALPLVAPDRAGATVPDAQPWRTHLLGEHDWCYSHEQANYYLTDGRWKYMWFPYLGKEQLFDRAADPGEEHDLSSDAGAADELKRWRQVMVEELSERECGLVEDGELVTVPQDQAIKSPHMHQYGCSVD
ncbi:MAG: arylsulfatase [Armatimonadota bacterium]